MDGGVDFDKAMQAFGTIAYGPGAKILIIVICGYLGAWGMAHERMWAVVCALGVAVFYFGAGVFLGKIGIA